MTAVFGITGWSGSGKTSLIERVVPLLTARGLIVGAFKHAHHSFDIDLPGKDSHRFRSAGCREVAVSSSRRWVLIHEHGEEDEEAAMNDMLARFDSSCDLILVEGYKNASIPKIEVWRREVGQSPIAMENPHVVAVATDDEIDGLPAHCARLPLDDAAVIAEFITQRADS